MRREGENFLRAVCDEAVRSLGPEPEGGASNISLLALQLGISESVAMTIIEYFSPIALERVNDRRQYGVIDVLMLGMTIGTSIVRVQQQEALKERVPDAPPASD